MEHAGRGLRKESFMRRTLVLLPIMAVAFALCAGAAEPDAAKLKRLSELLNKGTAPQGKLTEEEKEEVTGLLKIVLPEPAYIGEDKEWQVEFHDMDGNDFFSVNLKKKGDKSFNKYMWFHVLYKMEKPKSYGSEDFGDYRGMGLENVHYFILVGKLEIRAVASSEEYKNDEKIKGMLKAFKLKSIEKL